MKTLEQKVEYAIRLLKSIRSDEVELSFSGGKDSSVILELAKLAQIPYKGIYKMTTIDPPGTIAFCKENNIEILKPKYSFFELIQKKGFPTMRCRFCCDILKEYKVLDNAIQGIRRCESVKRKARYKEPVICRIYGNNKKNHVNVFLPILDWSDEDVEEFIKIQSVKCHPLYYDCDGNFNVKKRLGCLTCPLKSDKGLQDFKNDPGFVKAYIKNGLIWWNRPRTKPLRSHENFESIYDLFVHNIFFKSYEEFRIAKNGMFGRIDCKEFLNNYFKIEL